MHSDRFHYVYYIEEGYVSHEFYSKALTRWKRDAKRKKTFY